MTLQLELKLYITLGLVKNKNQINYEIILVITLCR